MVASATAPDRPAERARNLLFVAVVLLAASSTVSTFAAIHFRHQVSQLHAYQPSAASFANPAVPTRVQQAAPTSAASTPSAVASAPPLTVHSYDLPTNDQRRVTVYLTTASTDGGLSTDGQVLITALIRGTSPGQIYRLTGGDCDNPQLNPSWAEGVADGGGTAFLTGPPFTLPKADNYTLELVVGRPEDLTSKPPGMNGLFVLGQAAPYVGHACN